MDKVETLRADGYPTSDPPKECDYCHEHGHTGARGRKLLLHYDEHLSTCPATALLDK